MPSMPRVSEKASKIAFEILGVPAPMQWSKKNEKQKEQDKRLTFEETTRAR